MADGYHRRIVSIEMSEDPDVVVEGGAEADTGESKEGAAASGGGSASSAPHHRDRHLMRSVTRNSPPPGDGDPLSPGLRRRKAKKPSTKPPGNNVESLDFDHFESSVWQTSIKNKPYNRYSSETAWRWFITFIIGVGTALIAFFITFCTRNLAYLKFERMVQPLIDMEMAGTLPWCTAFVAYLSFNLVLVAIAATMVTVFEPMSGGSGIPEIKVRERGSTTCGCLRVHTSPRRPTHKQHS
jgi:hypothetical protein